MTHNKSGALHRVNREWGSKGRKRDDDQRALNNRGRKEAIEDQTNEGVLCVDCALPFHLCSCPSGFGERG